MHLSKKITTLRLSRNYLLTLTENLLERYLQNSLNKVLQKGTVKLKEIVLDTDKKQNSV